MSCACMSPCTPTPPITCSEPDDILVVAIPDLITTVFAFVIRATSLFKF